MSIVVVNAGSSSIKFGLFNFETLASQVRGLLEWGDGATESTLTLTPADGEATCRQIVASDHQEGVGAALEQLVSDHAAVRAVGHHSGIDIISVFPSSGSRSRRLDKRRPRDRTSNDMQRLHEEFEPLGPGGRPPSFPREGEIPPHSAWGLPSAPSSRSSVATDS